MLCSPQSPLRALAAVSLIVALFGSPALGAPAPLTDVSRTSIDVHTARREFRSNSPRFTVTLHRVDDLVSDAGAVVAERRSSYELSFDVAYVGGDSLLLNGVPVAANVVNSAVQMRAAMVVDGGQLGELENASGSTFRSTDDVRKAAEDAFDFGLATVEVRVRATTVYIRVAPDAPALRLRRFALSEKVIEVNGLSVVQTAFGEQIYYVAPDGSFVGMAGGAGWASVTTGAGSAAAAGVPASAVAPEASEMKSAVNGGCQGSALRARFAHWFAGLSPFSSLLFISSLVTAGLAGVFALVAAVGRLVKFSRGAGQADEDVEKTACEKASPYSYGLVPVAEKIPACPPSYETLVDEAQAGDDSSVSLEGKQPADGETEKDALCQ